MQKSMKLNVPEIVSYIYGVYFISDMSETNFAICISKLSDIASTYLKIFDSEKGVWHFNESIT